MTVRSDIVCTEFNISHAIHSSARYEVVPEFTYAAFSNAGGSKLSDVENEAKFRTLDPL